MILCYGWEFTLLESSDRFSDMNSRCYVNIVYVCNKQMSTLTSQT